MLGTFPLAALITLSLAAPVNAAPPTPGYPEPVVQWGVQKGETCEDIAKSLYGAPRYALLVQRYNHVVCKTGAPLREGLTLVLPATPTTLPDARLRSFNPAVRARPGGGGWSPAAAGMALFSNYNVNTLDEGRADIEFIDRTRVFLAPNTLVVIYGTANQTRVSKSAPALVEVDAGEVKAALASLRGDPAAAEAPAVEVAIKGGGRVRATSKDTVVQRKGDRTTVAVFQGKAGVTAGGKVVEVPQNFGTRFVGVTPPAPPRPLPPAPVLSGGLGGLVLVALGDKGAFDVAWSAVPKAAQYRIDLEREKADGSGELEIVSRHEVPATVTAFHGEKLPLGNYRVQVRAIDKEEYLGIAAQHPFRFVEVGLTTGSGSVHPHQIDANPYGTLKLSFPRDLEMALDDGPFGPPLDTLDLRRQAPRALRLRRQGASAVETIPIRYAEVQATVQASSIFGAADPGAGRPAWPKGIAVHVELSNVKGIDVGARIHPSARLHPPAQEGGSSRAPSPGVLTVALTVTPDGSLTGTIPLEAPLVAPARVDVVDDRGVLLGMTEYIPPPPPPRRPPDPLIGPYAPLWPATTGADILAFAPTPANGAAVSVGMLHAAKGWAAVGQVRASGNLGPIGVETALHTSITDGVSAYGAGWLGARVRVLHLEGAALEVAPAVRVGFPLSASGLPAQIEPAVAVGGVARPFTWLVDLGGRVRTAADGSETAVPLGQGFAIAAGTLDIFSWLRVHVLLDGQLVVRERGEKRGFGGLGAGLEAGGVVYGGLGVHLSPWTDPGVGPFLGQLTLGVRGVP